MKYLERRERQRNVVLVDVDVSNILTYSNIKSKSGLLVCKILEIEMLVIPVLLFQIDC